MEAWRDSSARTISRPRPCVFKGQEAERARLARTMTGGAVLPRIGAMSLLNVATAGCAGATAPAGSRRQGAEDRRQGAP
jgi:hypothetical protein